MNTPDTEERPYDETHYPRVGQTDGVPASALLDQAPSRPVGGVEEMVDLVGQTARLWRRHIWSMGVWFCLGAAVHTAALLASAALGATHPTLATLVFVIGVLATLVALVLMIHSLEPSLRAPAAIDGDPDRLAAHQIPARVLVREGRWQVVAAAVGPFLAVYAVWGFVDDQVRELFGTNYRLLGLDPERFSISFAPDRLRSYLLLAVVVWVVRRVVELFGARRPRPALALVGVVAEAVWVFSVFALLVIVLGLVRTWLRSRAGYAVLVDGWHTLLARLPDWPLPFDLTLPRALEQLASALVATVLPGAWHALVLPLVWLALTATVLGWRDFGSGDLLAQTRPVGRRFPAGDRTRALVLLATADLRTKYLPVLQALRLVVRAGPAFLGAYLLLATVLTAVQTWFDIAVTLILGPRSATASLATDPVSLLISGLLFTPVGIALYGAGFDRALAAAGEVDLRAGTPRPPGRGPSTAASAPTTRTRRG